MTTYVPPLDDMRFTLSAIAGMDRVIGLPGNEGLSADLVDQVLAEAGKFAAEVLGPLNRIGDIERSRFENGAVVTPRGFKEAYAQFVAAGWSALPADPDYGGQGLPQLIAAPVLEMWSAANLAWSLCPLLSQSAVTALGLYGSAAQKRLYLPKLVSGEWPGTMNLTEPQAGSDLGTVRTRASRAGDHYLIRGQKIFITWGEHDMAPNIIHLVLARVDSAPSGTRGLSLFIVSKFLVAVDGALGRRNDLRCVSIEHKLGIHASPTCVMAYGDDSGAVGFLIGEENRGIEYMFAMMNSARFAVGVEGLAIADRAYQQALDYARTRIQGRDLVRPGHGAVAIIDHPDVRRMLLTMRAGIQAMRALAYETAALSDLARRDPNDLLRAQHGRRLDLLIPVVKAWCTDLGCEIASLGVQVHGGAGYLEETGAAQHLRDARITPIYEGTNGIQALDLVRRKIGGDGGAAMLDLLEAMRAEMARWSDRPAPRPELRSCRAALDAALAPLEQATRWMAEMASTDLRLAAAGASPYLRLVGTVLGGFLLARGAEAAALRLGGDDSAAFLRGHLATAKFYAENFLVQSDALARMATQGAESVAAFDDAAFRAP